MRISSMKLSCTITSSSCDANCDVDVEIEADFNAAERVRIIINI